MKKNYLQLTGLALLCALSFTACKPDKEEEIPAITALVSGAVRSAGSGDCAISINLTGLYFGQIASIAVSGSQDDALGGGFRTHYNAVNTTATVADQTALIAAPYTLKYDTFFTDRGTWNAAARATYLNNLGTALASNTTIAAMNGVRGTAILACARIPRSSCTNASLTVQNIAADITSQTNSLNLALTTPECRKTAAVRNELVSQAFIGAATTRSITGIFGQTGNFSPISGGGNGLTGSNVTGFFGSRIIAENAYPKFGTLINIGFQSLMPISFSSGSTSTAYALSATAFTRGANLSATPVDSCESLGLRGVGPTQATTATTPLSPAKEIAYTFSTNGSAASLYAASVGVSTPTGTQASEDAIQCNSTLRKSFRVPLALNQGGTLDDVSAVSGDGGATATLTTCLYGGTSTARTTASSLVGTLTGGAISGMLDCPAAAASAAARFGDAGLQTVTTFPNAN